MKERIDCYQQSVRRPADRAALRPARVRYGSCSALQCVAVCCSVLQYVAVCCREMQCVAVSCSELQ